MSPRTALRPLATVTGPVGLALTNSMSTRSPVAAGARPQPRPARRTSSHHSLKRARMQAQVHEPRPGDLGARDDVAPRERADELLGDRSRRLAGALGERHGDVRREVPVLGPLGSLERPSERLRRRRRPARPGTPWSRAQRRWRVRTRSARLMGKRTCFSTARRARCGPERRPRPREGASTDAPGQTTHRSRAPSAAHRRALAEHQRASSVTPGARSAPRSTQLREAAATPASRGWPRDSWRRSRCRRRARPIRTPGASRRSASPGCTRRRPDSRAPGASFRSRSPST